VLRSTNHGLVATLYPPVPGLGATAGFAIVSLNAGWKPAQGWLVTGGVDNLFNRACAEPISKGTSAIPGSVVQSIRVNEPGRMLWLKASLTFGR
jgi:iron complex outermembrane receptor protein